MFSLIVMILISILSLTYERKSSRARLPNHKTTAPWNSKIMIIITDYDIIYNEEDDIFPKEQ